MFDTAQAFSGFSVNDVDAAKKFYGETLQVPFTEDHGMLKLHLGPGKDVLVYPKGDEHVPAEYTMLNFAVDDIDSAVEKLRSVGITPEPFDGVDDKGVMRLGGPPIAWFKDPAGNICSVIQED
ncbi:MAG TPA: VOC family protein [Jatrophihabitans sp.]|jgi:predicted enzyme related to lactoylglutathione lyase|uniref:VOC family protein n=1 Tax=Jatrophihabitans sp. TaxID=1932789 RepID=UPI002EFF2360